MQRRILPYRLIAEKHSNRERTASFWIFKS